MGDILNTILRNKFFYFIIVFIIIALIINKYKDVIKNYFKPKVLDTEVDAKGSVIMLSDIRKREIETTASDLRNDLSQLNWTGTHERKYYETAINMRDSELQYLARYYKKAYGTSLLKDINSDFFPFVDYNTRLVDKLIKIGER